MVTTTTTHANWYEALLALVERDGVIDLTRMAPSPADDTSVDVPLRLVEGDDEVDDETARWRVRVLGIEGDHLVVERPMIGGRLVTLDPGERVEALLIDGNRRWAFTSTVVQQMPHPLNDRQTVQALRLAWPQEVRDAQRREHFRVHVAGAVGEPVRLSVLNDLCSSVAYQRYNRAIHRPTPGASEPIAPPPPPMLGPTFEATLINVSGGGICCRLGAGARPYVNAGTRWWVRLHVPPHEPPIYAVAQAAHLHRADRDHIEVGFAFTFAHDPAHERFVNDALCRAAAHLQRLTLKRQR